MQLETDLHHIADVQAEDLRRILASLAPGHDSRAILSVSDDHYIQTATFDNGFVIERREGSEESHAHAVPAHPELPPLRPKPKRSWWERLLKVGDFLTSECAFSQTDMIEIFEAYFQGREPTVKFTWDSGYCDK